MTANIKKYIRYANSPEAFAILFVKRYLKQADTSVWVDILSYNSPRGYDMSKLQFKSVVCELFPRRTKPVYPPQKSWQSRHDYEMECRAITWGTATRDIEEARWHGYVGLKYRIDAVCFPISSKDSGGYFIDSAPPEIKALAANLNDRTDPLWDKAMKYVRHEEPTRYKLEIKRVCRVGDSQSSKKTHQTGKDGKV